MQKEIASGVILTNLMNSEDVGLNQIRMWLTPQKDEHDHEYDINRGYFELLLTETLQDLITKGYVESTSRDGVEDGDERLFSLTEKGMNYLKKELIAAQNDR